MNLHEKKALEDFLNEMKQVRVQNKDWEAESMILDAVGQQPDAPYLLVQRALLQEQALNAAQQQIASMQQQLNATRQGHGGGFLDRASDWGHAARYRTARPLHPGRSGSRDVYGGAQPYYDMPVARPGLMSGGMGSFLGSMAGVAAGVAAGSFLYHGIDHLLHHNDAPGSTEQAAHLEQQGLSDTSGEQAAPDHYLSDAGLDADAASGEAGFDDTGSWGDSDSGMGDTGEGYV